MESGSGGILTIEQAIEAFAAEVAYWREVRGLSKKVLANAMGYTPAYVSHMESGRHSPSADFAHRADGALNAGGAIEQRGREYAEAAERDQGRAGECACEDGAATSEQSSPEQPPPEQSSPEQSSPGQSSPERHSPGQPPPGQSAHGQPPAGQPAPGQLSPGAAQVPLQRNPAGRPLLPDEPRQPAEPPYATSSALVVEHEAACLEYDGSGYRLSTRRLLRNVGREPITRFLIRISVDRYPGEPERSRAHYRLHPLTWAGLELTAHCGDQRMRLVARHDREAFKEVWLRFENDQGDFALPPGASAWIEYGYRVSDQQWGQWFQRAVRLPTKRLEVRVAFPRALDPVLWGTETFTGARRIPLRTPPERHDDEAGLRAFSWSTATPPLHARYRLEWRFAARENGARP